MHIGRLDAVTVAKPQSHPLPDEDADDGADRGDDDLADQAVGAEIEQPGEKAADHRADDADQRLTNRSCWRPRIQER